MLTRSALVISTLLATTVATETPRSQSVLTVASGGGADFTSVGGAVQAATPGDTILVAAGSYSGAIIDKSVRIIADGNAVEFFGDFVVQSLSADETVLIQGFRSLASNSQPTSVRIEDCAGTVWIEEVIIQSSNPFAATTPFRIVNSPNVTLLQCIGDSTPFVGLFSSRPGLDVETSTVSIFGSEFRGAASTQGAEVFASTFFAQNCTFRGGDAEDGGIIGAPGGPGIRIESGSDAVFRANTTIGGTGGVPLIPGGQPGAAGAPTEVSANSTLTDLPGAAHVLNATAPAREGQAVDYVIEGPAGNLTALNFALAPEPIFFALTNGTLLLGTNFVSIPVGAIPTGGSLTIPTVAPQLGPGAEVLTFFVQLIAIDLSVPAAFVGTGQALTLLDAGF